MRQFAKSDHRRREGGLALPGGCFHFFSYNRFSLVVSETDTTKRYRIEARKRKHDGDVVLSKVPRLELMERLIGHRIRWQAMLSSGARSYAAVVDPLMLPVPKGCEPGSAAASR